MHTHRAHCVWMSSDHESTHPKADTDKNSVSPQNSKRSMTFAVARIAEYSKNAGYGDKKNLSHFLQKWIFGNFGFEKW